MLLIDYNTNIISKGQPDRMKIFRIIRLINALQRIFESSLVDENHCIDDNIVLRYQVKRKKKCRSLVVVIRLSFWFISVWSSCIEIAEFPNGVHWSAPEIQRMLMRPASFSVHLASSAVTPAGSVHKSRCDNGGGGAYVSAAEEMMSVVYVSVTKGA